MYTITIFVFVLYEQKYEWEFDDELYTILKCNDFNCAKFDEKGNTVRKCYVI